MKVINFSKEDKSFYMVSFHYFYILVRFGGTEIYLWAERREILHWSKGENKYFCPSWFAFKERAVSKTFSESSLDPT